MSVTLSPEIQKLLEERIKRGGYSTVDDLVRAALETLDHLEADELDEATVAAIDRAEAQYARGEGMDVDEAFEQIRRKHFND
jgi:Arc/MetJ-type ribon-helix-helix transcriptional regulator